MRSTAEITKFKADIFKRTPVFLKTPGVIFLKKLFYFFLRASAWRTLPSSIPK